MNITIFCSRNDIPEVYTGPAIHLVRLLAHAGHTIIWGGSNIGLMKQIADAAQEEKGKIVGISVDLLKNLVRTNADEMIVAKTMSERKKMLLERADAILIFAGGLGTLAEAFEVIDLKKLGVHNKPVIVLNTNDFYNNLKIQLEKMYREGFIQKEINSLVKFAKTPEEVISMLSLSLPDDV